MNTHAPVAMIALLLSAMATAATDRAQDRHDPPAERDRTHPLVIIEQEPPGDAFAPTAGETGFSEGHAAAQAQDHFLALDRDGSGQLDRSEIPHHTRLGSRFADYDLNADGAIARNEFQSWYAATSALEGVAATDDWDAIAADED